VRLGWIYLDSVGLSQTSAGSGDPAYKLEAPTRQARLWPDRPPHRELGACQDEPRFWTAVPQYGIAALGLDDMSSSPKARSCPRTPQSHPYPRKFLNLEWELRFWVLDFRLRNFFIFLLAGCTRMYADVPG